MFVHVYVSTRSYDSEMERLRGGPTRPLGCAYTYMYMYVFA